MKFRKNLYGHTAEGRQIWPVTGQHSYTKGSKEQGWECIRTRMDPWLFIITCVYDELIWCSILVHGDDCDIAAQSQHNGWWCTCSMRYHLGLYYSWPRSYDGSTTQSNPRWRKWDCPIMRLWHDSYCYRNVQSLQWSDDWQIQQFTDWSELWGIYHDIYIHIMAYENPEIEPLDGHNAGYQCGMGMLLWADRRVYTPFVG